PRFGRDFSQVRVHSNAKASSAAASIDARAFTVGRDIVFGAGEYAPNGAAGRTLISHELAHVVQQGDAASAMIRRQPGKGDGGKGAAEKTPEAKKDDKYDGLAGQDLVFRIVSALYEKTYPSKDGAEGADGDFSQYDKKAVDDSSAAVKKLDKTALEFLRSS